MLVLSRVGIIMRLGRPFINHFEDTLVLFHMLTIVIFPLRWHDLAHIWTYKVVDSVGYHINAISRRWT